MSEATPPRRLDPTQVPLAPIGSSIDAQQAAVEQTRAQGARVDVPAPNAAYEGVLRTVREMERLELEQRLDPRNAVAAQQVGQFGVDPTTGARFGVDPTGANRTLGPLLTPDQQVDRSREDAGNAALSSGRIGAELGLGFFTGGLSILPRVGATTLGAGAIEATYGALLGHSTDEVVEDFAAGGAAGYLSEIALAGAGAAGRGAFSVARRVLRRPVSQRGRDLAVAHAVEVSRQVGAQPSAAMVLDSPTLTKIEQYVENSIGGGALRDLRARNIETVRSDLLAQTNLVPSPQDYDLDAFLGEVLDGRLDAARGYAAAYYKSTFDAAAGGVNGVRYRPKVPSDFAREQLADQRLGFGALQDDTYKSVLMEMLQTKSATFERMQRWRSQLFAYSKMFDPSGRVKAEAQASAAKMAHQLTERMGNAAAAMGRGEEWKLANQIWADEVAGLYTTQMLRRIARDEPTKVARSLLRNGTGAEVKAVRKALGIAEDGSFRPIAVPTTPEGLLAAKQQAREAEEAWRRVQGAHLWNAVIDSSKVGLDLSNPAAARQALTPSGDAFVTLLFKRGDSSGEFIRALYNTPAARKSFESAARLGETLRYYQAAPEGGGIALRVIETQAVLSLGIGTATGLATGDASAGIKAAGGSAVAMLLGERAMASLMASPRFVSALESGIRATPGSNAAKRAGLMLGIEVLRDSSVSDAARAQADALVAELSSALGIDPETARRAAKDDATAFINRAAPLVTDRADVGGIR